MTEAKKLAVVIMAAGKGIRMNNPDMAKVMYTVNGKPMVEYIVDLADNLQSTITIVVVGWQRDSVIDHLNRTHKGITFVEQTPQLGTGHAVMKAEPALREFIGDVLVLSGDVPLLSLQTTRMLIDHQGATKASATVLTAELDDATGYGRILRNEDGSVKGIVEHKDATAEERQIREINSGIYVFDAVQLFAGLRHLTPTNAQKEYYLTDVFGHFWRNKLRVEAAKTDRKREIQGINTPEQLEEARSAFA